MPDPVSDGPALTIRRASPKDAAALTQLMSEPAVFGGLLQLPCPSEERWHAVLSEAVGPGKGELSLVALRAARWSAPPASRLPAPRCGGVTRWASA